MRRLPAVLIAAGDACLLLLTAADGPQARLASARSNGGWGNAHRVLGVAALAPRGFWYAVSLSCASQASCTIGGSYTTARGVPRTRSQGSLRSTSAIRERSHRCGAARQGTAPIWFSAGGPISASPSAATWRGPGS